MAPPPRDGVTPPSTFAEGRSKRDRLLQSEERQLPVPVAQSQRSSHYRFKRPDSPAPHAHERRSVAYYMLPLLAHERAATRHSQEPDSSAPSTAVNEDPLDSRMSTSFGIDHFEATAEFSAYMENCITYLMERHPTISRLGREPPPAKKRPAIYKLTHDPRTIYEILSHIDDFDTLVAALKSTWLFTKIWNQNGGRLGPIIRNNWLAAELERTLMESRRTMPVQEVLHLIELRWKEQWFRQQLDR